MTNEEKEVRKVVRRFVCFLFLFNALLAICFSSMMNLVIAIFLVGVLILSREHKLEDKK